MAEKESKPLVEVKASLANLDVNLNGLEGFANNLIKALSRGLGIFGEPLRRWLDARADRGIANQRFKAIIDFTKNQAELVELRKRLGALVRSQQSIDVDFGVGQHIIAITARDVGCRSRGRGRK